MSKVETISIENIRCFKEKQEIKIRPITLLMGDNSAGKSTVLWAIHNMLHSVSKVIENGSSAGTLNLNQAPYYMGGYEGIVCKFSQKKEIELGISFDNKNLRRIEIVLNEIKDKNSPQYKKIIYYFSNVTIEIGKIQNNGKSYKLELKNKGKTKKFNIYIPYFYNNNLFSIFDITISNILNNGEIKNNIALIELNKFLTSKANGKSKNKINAFSKNLVNYSGNSPISIGAVRSQPLRTYEPFKEYPDPEGSDIPNYLMQLKTNNKAEWKKLKNNLEKFGKKSGLFDSIDVIKYVDSKVSPFQIHVKVRGVENNVIDVGYGVSQIIPVITKLYSESKHSTFLLQDPENNLYPKSQAELISLFVNNIKSKNNNTFILETHGDSLISRLKIEIREGNISTKDVNLVYFDVSDKHVKIHNIEFDRIGNYVRTPKSYRNFFNDETNRLFGIA